MKIPLGRARGILFLSTVVTLLLVGAIQKCSGNEPASKNKTINDRNMHR